MSQFENIALESLKSGVIDLSRPHLWPGTVAVTVTETARYTAFYQALSATRLPPNSGIFWATGVDVVHGCNAAVEHMQGEWIWLLGDDHHWHPSLLLDLLALNLPVVVPIVLQKQQPFENVLFQHPPGSTDIDTYRRVDLRGKSGVIRIDAAGTAGMLIRRSVFEKLEKPYFKLPYGDMQKVSEDVYFCQQLEKAGIPLHAALDHPMGHITPATISAARSEEGEWFYRFDVGEGTSFHPMSPHYADTKGAEDGA